MNSLRTQTDRRKKRTFDEKILNKNRRINFERFIFSPQASYFCLYSIIHNEEQCLTHCKSLNARPADF